MDQKEIEDTFSSGVDAVNERISMSIEFLCSFFYIDGQINAAYATLLKMIDRIL